MLPATPKRTRLTSAKSTVPTRGSRTKPTSPGRPPPSEIQARRDLRSSRRARSGGLHEQPVDLIVLRVEAHAGIDTGELRVIEGVVGLEAELAASLFADLQIAVDADVPVVRPRSA